MTDTQSYYDICKQIVIVKHFAIAITNVLYWCFLSYRINDK